MAASIPPQSQRQEDFKEQFLTCSLCTEPYDNNQHQAKFLPCLHSYCKSCLRQHAGKRPKINCPNCRREVVLPDGTVDSLPNDFIVENLKDFQDVFNLAVNCGSCDEGSQAVGFCHDCGCFLCKACVDNHQKMRPLRHHKLSTIAELQKERRNPMMQQRCQKHPTMPLELYCKEVDCKMPACASCGLIDHRGHEIVDLLAASDEMVAIMRQSSANIAIRNQDLTDNSAALDIMQKTLTDNFSKLEKSMQESIQKVHSLIDTQYKHAHSHLKHLYQTEMNRLAESQESADLLGTQMISACEFADKACDVSHPTQLLSSHNQIMEHLHELENTEVPVIESDKTDFMLTTKHHAAIQQIEDSLQRLCDVDWLRKPQADALQSRIVFAKFRMEGQICREATVQAVGVNGQLITTSGDKVVATHNGVEIRVTDHENGSFTFYVPILNHAKAMKNLRSAQYGRLQMGLNVTINGVLMKGSPFAV